MTPLTPKTHHNLPEAGFTLIEVLVVVIIIGILAGIAGPSWITWITQQRINATNSAVISAIEKARNDAQAKKVPQTVAFRVINGVPQVAVFPMISGDETLTTEVKNRLDSIWEQGRVTGVNPGEVLLMSNLAGENDRNADGTGDLSATTPASPAVNIIASRADNNAFWNNTANKLPPHRITFDHNGMLAGDEPDAELMVFVSMPARRDSATPTPMESRLRCVRVGTLIGGLQLGRSADECTSMRQRETP